MEVVRNVRRGLSSYGDLDERQIESCAVEPCLTSLGWEPFPWDRRNQYRIENGRKVDIALGEFGDDVMNPIVFIECKRPGRLSPAGETQLFEYAQGRGIPLLVLTDGKRWDLYLSMAPGEPGKRRFETLDLVDDDTAETAEKLHRYLAKDEVLSNRAATAAERRRQTSDAIHRVEKRMADTWNQLLTEPDETLAELFEARLLKGLPAGLRPSPDGLRESVAAFLRRRAALPEVGAQGGYGKTTKAMPVKCRWRHRGENEWRYPDLQATVQVGVANDIAVRVFGGNADAMLEAWRRNRTVKRWRLLETEQVEREGLRYFQPLPDVPGLGMYVRLGWNERLRILKRLLALEGVGSPIEIEYAQPSRDEPGGEAALVWKRI